MSFKYRLTPRAAEDLDAIADFTIETWGVAQLDIYLQAMHKRFEWLCENPQAGRARNDVHRGYRSFAEGSHVIFYIISGEYVDIIGLPHKSMDIGAQLLQF